MELKESTFKRTILHSEMIKVRNHLPDKVAEVRTVWELKKQLGVIPKGKQTEKHNCLVKYLKVLQVSS